jgi:hypothetical protein
MRIARIMVGSVARAHRPRWRAGRLEDLEGVAQTSRPILDQNIARWLLVLAEITPALTAHPQVRAWWRRRLEREALRVVIERAEWSNFRHLALIVETRVTVEPYGHAETARRISTPDSLRRPSRHWI